MSYLNGPRPKFDMGRVIERAFGTLASNFLTLLFAALLFVFLPQAGLGYVQATWMETAANGGDPFADPSLLAAGFIVAGLLSFLLSALMQGVATHATVSDLQGRKVGLAQSLGAGLRSALPLIALGLLAALAVGLGFLLLIVPGVILMLMWCVAAPAVVIEKKGVFDALGRSRELTRNHRGVILGLAVIYWVAATMFGFLLGFLTVGVAGALSPQNAVLLNAALFNPLVTALSTMLSASGVAAIYVELRTLKEGAGTGRDEIAALFD